MDNKQNKKKSLISFIYNNIQKYNQYLNFDKIQDFRNYVLYNDSDSMFIHIDEFIRKTNKTLNDVINYLQDEVNKKILHNFAKLHNIDYSQITSEYLLPFEFKNEFFLKRMVLYAKKKYIGLIYNIEKGDVIVEIKGLEGKKTTSKLIKYIVDDFIRKISDDNFDINQFYDYNYYVELINDIKSYINKHDYIADIVDLIGEPVKKNKNYNDLKSLQSHSKGMILFDYYINKTQNQFFWLKYSGKGIVIPVKFKIFSDNFYTNIYTILKNTDFIQILKFYLNFTTIKEYNELEKSISQFISIYEDKYQPALNNLDTELITKLGKNREFKKYANSINKTITNYIQTITFPELIIDEDDTIIKRILDDLNLTIDYSKLFSKIYKKIDIFYKPFLEKSIKTDKKTLSENLDDVYDDETITSILKSIFTNNNNNTKDNNNTKLDDDLLIFVDDDTINDEVSLL